MEVDERCAVVSVVAWFSDDVSLKHRILKIHRTNLRLVARKESLTSFFLSFTCLEKIYQYINFS